nr:hypothetical protein [Tanacetum cinerariifolium]
MKVARYLDFGLELLVPEHMWINVVVRTYMRILSVVSIKAFSRYGYDYLKEITLRRADYQEYMIAKKHFKSFCPSDFEDLNLLLLQDFQLDIERYQKQLDLTKPGWDAKGFEYKHDYTIIDSPHAVVFPIGNNKWKIIRFNEIYIFSDGTLMNIMEVLDFRVKEYKIIMVNVIPPDHVDDIFVVEPNQHDDVPVVHEPVLVDEDEDPEEDEFEKEEDPQKEEDDMEVDIEEDEDEPELTYPYEEMDPLNPSSPAFESEPEDAIEVENPIEHEDGTVPASVHEVGESFTASFLFEDSDGLLPGLMRRDINYLFGWMDSLSRRPCGRETPHALVGKKGKAKDEFYGKLTLELGNEVWFYGKVNCTKNIDHVFNFIRVIRLGISSHDPARTGGIYPKDNPLVNVEVLRSDTYAGNPVKEILLKIEST